MSDAIRAPPWGNLWRHLVTTYPFFVLIAGILMLVSTVVTLPDWHGETIALPIAAITYVLAAIVVWSDVPWPGDPE